MLTVDQSSELGMIIAWGLRISVNEKVLSLFEKKRKKRGLLEKAAAYNGQLKKKRRSLF